MFLRNRNYIGILDYSDLANTFYSVIVIKYPVISYSKEREASNNSVKIFSMSTLT